MDNREISIDLKKLLRVLNYYKLHIIFAAIIITGCYAIFVCATHNSSIDYKATAQIYLEEKTIDEKASVGSSASEHSLNDYSKLIMSDFVLKSVQKKLAGDYSDKDMEEMYGQINTVQEDGSNIISIEVLNDNAKAARDIANCAADVATAKINNTSQYYDAYVTSYATKADALKDKSMLTGITWAFLIALFLSMIAVIGIWFVRNNIKDDDALSCNMNAEILASIPRSKDISGYINQHDVFEKLYICLKDAPMPMIVTSLNKGDGKSMIACGLAEEFKKAGRKTLLIEHQDGCDYMDRAFETNIQQNMAEHDTILIAPDAFDTLESYAYMEHCSSALVVIDPNKAGMRQLAAMKNRLDKAGCRIEGLVLNKVKY